MSSRIPVVNQQGQDVGAMEFSDDMLVLNRGEQALHDVIVAFQANQRSGTASTLTKAQVQGSNRKPWAQKGLGRARAGYRRSPIWRGGGVAFGPHPRDYTIRIPRNVGRLAFRRALSEKVVSGALRLVDELVLAAPKTKALADLLKMLNLKGMVLIVLDKADRNVTLAARNMPEVDVALARELHSYQMVRYPVLLVNRLGMKVLEQRLKAAVRKA